MIAYASRGTRVRPDDVIGSGTVGTGCILELSRVHGAETYPYLRADDRVRLEVAAGRYRCPHPAQAPDRPAAPEQEVPE